MDLIIKVTLYHLCYGLSIKHPPKRLVCWQTIWFWEFMTTCQWVHTWIRKQGLLKRRSPKAELQRGQRILIPCSLCSWLLWGEQLCGALPQECSAPAWPRDNRANKPELKPPRPGAKEPSLPQLGGFIYFVAATQSSIALQGLLRMPTHCLLLDHHDTCLLLLSLLTSLFIPS